MAISLTAAGSIVVKTSSFLAPTSSTLARFSSLHFPVELRISSIRSHCLKSKLRPRGLTVLDFEAEFLKRIDGNLSKVFYINNEDNKVSSTKQSFSSFDELLEKSDKPVLVDFYATWCGPCQFMVPILETVSGTMIDKIQVVKIDTEKYPAIANKYNIEALPTFILFKDGEPFDRFEGAMGAEQLIQRIEASLQVKQ